MTNSNRQGLYFERAQLKKIVRRFFDERDFLEVDTPCLVLMPGTETYLNYFESDWTDLAGKSSRLFLRSSPELHMKQILGGSEASGCRGKSPERIYQLGPCFRNRGELGPWHHPEFTMLEWYQQGIGYQGLIKQTEDLIRYCCEGMEQLGIATMKFPSAVAIFTVEEAFKEFAGIVLKDCDPDLTRRATTAGVISVRGDDDFETAFFKILLEKVEPALARFPVSVLCDYPASQAALAVVEEGVARRFEYFIGGVELSNAFLELGGRAENLKRIDDTAKRRRELGLEVPPVDEDFLDAMSGKFHDCAGNALGFDRLFAVLTGQSNLNQSVPFRFGAAWRRHFPK